MLKMDYETSGVSIDTANKAKASFGEIVSNSVSSVCKPLNKVGAFASLVDIDLAQFKSPVFVLKSEEPGSKQLLSIEKHKLPWLARDLINHLVNDIAVMGAIPCAVLDTIICGNFQSDVILELVREISKACSENNCVLVGGETSEQPGTLPNGRYVLQASILGVVDRDKIVDGSRIAAKDKVIAIASNGLHTNGYSLVRKLMECYPEILDEKIGEMSFMDSILLPHTAYYPAIKQMLDNFKDCIHGMAHITGGGIHDNFKRILEVNSIQADIDLRTIRIPQVFKTIRKYAMVSDDEMLKTFNLGVGLIAAVDADCCDSVCKKLNECGYQAYCIGEVNKTSSAAEVYFHNDLIWD